MFATLRAFLRLSRLKFLAGGFVGGGLGTAIAAYVTGRFDARAYALAQLTITGFHLMTHYANDYFDRAADARSTPTPYSGGSGALVDGSLAPRVALVAALACAAVGLGGCLALATVASAGGAAAIGVAIGALAWAYSAPPLRLLARGWGELDTALVVAVLVPLCAYAAQRPPATLLAVASTLPAAAAMFAMMLAVEIPDLASDAVGGKHNLVVRGGIGRTRAYGLAATAMVYAAVAIAVGVGAPPALAILEACSLPLGIGYARALRARAAREIAPFERTGRSTIVASAREAAEDEDLAARGVAFFFIVSLDALLAYAAAPRP